MATLSVVGNSDAGAVGLVPLGGSSIYRLDGLPPGVTPTWQAQGPVACTCDPSQPTQVVVTGFRPSGAAGDARLVATWTDPSTGAASFTQSLTVFSVAVRVPSPGWIGTGAPVGLRAEVVPAGLPAATWTWSASDTLAVTPGDAGAATVLATGPSSVGGASVTATATIAGLSTPVTASLTTFVVLVRAAASGAMPSWLPVGGPSFGVVAEVVPTPPPGGVTYAWTVAGSLTLDGASDGSAAAIRAAQPGRDGVVGLTVTIGQGAATAKQAVGSYAAQIVGLGAPAPANVGLGGLQLYTFAVTPDDGPTLSPAWSTAGGVEVTGAADQAVVSVRGTAVGPGALRLLAAPATGPGVDLTLPITTFGVRIRSTSGGDPPTLIPVGAAPSWVAEITPSGASATATRLWASAAPWRLAPPVDPSAGTAAFEGLSPSPIEGADAVSVTVVVDGSTTSATLPVTVLSGSLVTPAGAALPRWLPVGSPLEAEVRFEPPVTFDTPPVRTWEPPPTLQSTSALDGPTLTATAVTASAAADTDTLRCHLLLDGEPLVLAHPLSTFTVAIRAADALAAPEPFLATSARRAFRAVVQPAPSVTPRFEWPPGATNRILLEAGASPDSVTVIAGDTPSGAVGDTPLTAEVTLDGGTATASLALTVVALRSLVVRIPPSGPLTARAGNAAGVIEYSGGIAGAYDWGRGDFLTLVAGATPPLEVRLLAEPAAVPVRWALVRAADDLAGLATPVLTPQGGLPLATLAVNGAGSFTLTATVAATDAADAPTLTIGVVEVAVTQPEPDTSTIDATRIVASVQHGDLLIESGTFDVHQPTVNLLYLSARVALLGGGADGRRGVDRVSVGWVNNVVAPENNVATYSEGGTTQTIFALNKADATRFTQDHTELFVAGSPPAPDLAAPPLLDSGRANPGTGGATATLSSSQDPRDAGYLGAGEQRVVLAVDCPSDFAALTFVLTPPNQELQSFRIEMSFGACLAAWTRDASMAYAALTTLSWTMSAEATARGSHATLTRQAAAIPARTVYPAATPARDAGVETRFPTALELLAVEAGG